MSCACEHKRMSSEYERILRLAKAFAQLEEDTVAIYANDDGTYGFCLASLEIDKTIIEYISPY